MKGRSRKPAPPAPRGAAAGTSPIKGILELDRFNEVSLERWSELSADLDELQDILYFNLEPERRRRRPELLTALRETTPESLQLENWVRIVDYQWTLHPLSAAGSLTSIGGRFNAGTEIDSQIFSPWPSLYLASDHATAYREKFQIDAGQMVEGLSPEELALTPGKSHTTVVLNGNLSRVFPMTPTTLGPVARILGKIKMPDRAERIKKKLKFNPNDLRMMRLRFTTGAYSQFNSAYPRRVKFCLSSSGPQILKLLRTSPVRAEASAWPFSWIGLRQGLSSSCQATLLRVQ